MNLNKLFKQDGRFLASKKINDQSLPSNRVQSAPAFINPEYNSFSINILKKNNKEIGLKLETRLIGKEGQPLTVVSEVVEKGPAFYATSGHRRIEPGDQFLAVNGEKVLGLRSEQIMQMIRQSSALVRLRFIRDTMSTNRPVSSRDAPPASARSVGIARGSSQNFTASHDIPLTDRGLQINVGSRGESRRNSRSQDTSARNAGNEKSDFSVWSNHRETNESLSLKTVSRRSSGVSDRDLRDSKGQKTDLKRSLSTTTKRDSVGSIKDKSIF